MAEHAANGGGLTGVNAIMNHPRPTQLPDRAEIERTINLAKGLRAEMFRTAWAATIGFVCTLVSTTSSNFGTFKRQYARWREFTY